MTNEEIGPAVVASCDSVILIVATSVVRGVSGGVINVSIIWTWSCDVS